MNPYATLHLQPFAKSNATQIRKIYTNHLPLARLLAFLLALVG